MALKGNSWTNIGERGKFTVFWDVLCEYRSLTNNKNQVCVRRVAHTTNKEEADYICNLLNSRITEMHPENMQVYEFIAIDNEMYHNTQVNEKFLNKLFNEEEGPTSKATDILRDIWTYEDELKKQYRESTNGISED